MNLPEGVRMTLLPAAGMTVPAVLDVSLDTLFAPNAAYQRNHGLLGGLPVKLSAYADRHTILSTRFGLIIHPVMAYTLENPHPADQVAAVVGWHLADAHRKIDHLLEDYERREKGPMSWL